MSYRKVRLLDVARLAGVSEASASAVLNEKHEGTIRVGKQTRKNVQAAARQLGYVPNQAARNLRQEGGGLIAVFTYEPVFPSKPTAEFHGFFSGIEQEAAKRGFDLLVINDRRRAASSRITLAGGGIMIGISRDDKDIRSLIRREFPLVFVGRREIAGAKTHWVTFDYDGVIQSAFGRIPRTVPGILFLASANDQSEPTKDKEESVTRHAQEKGFPLCRIPFEGTLTPQAEELVRNGWYVLLDRLWMADPVAPFYRKEGIDPFGFLLEDNWMGLPLAWPHWSNGREALGSLAVTHLSDLIAGREPEQDRLIPLSIETMNPRP